MGGGVLACGRLEACSAFENHLGDGLLRGVRQRQSDIFRSEPLGELPALAVKCHGRTASGLPEHFAIAPTHAMVPAGAQSFHGGFLGGEAGGIALHTIRLRIAIANLSGGKDALQETLPETLNGLSNARNFGDVDPCAYDHVCVCTFGLNLTADGVIAADLRDRSNVRRRCELLPSACAA